MLGILQGSEEAILVVNGVWEIGCRPAIVFGEAEIDNSACVDTSEQVGFV